jgi:hypothetical protein
MAEVMATYSVRGYFTEMAERCSDCTIILRHSRALTSFYHVTAHHYYADNTIYPNRANAGINGYSIICSNSMEENSQCEISINIDSFVFVALETYFFLLFQVKSPPPQLYSHSKIFGPNKLAG